MKNGCGIMKGDPITVSGVVYGWHTHTSRVGDRSLYTLYIEDDLLPVTVVCEHSGRWARSLTVGDHVAFTALVRNANRVAVHVSDVGDVAVKFGG